MFRYTFPSGICCLKFPSGMLCKWGSGPIVRCFLPHFLVGLCTTYCTVGTHRTISLRSRSQEEPAEEGAPPQPLLPVRRLERQVWPPLRLLLLLRLRGRRRGRGRSRRRGLHRRLRCRLVRRSAAHHGVLVIRPQGGSSWEGGGEGN